MMILKDAPDGGELPSRLLLPRIPLSTMNWLGAFGQAVWERHQKCHALLLLANPIRQSWSVTVPPQSPREDGVSWRVANVVPHGEVDPGTHLVAGSFQMCRAAVPEDALDLVPPGDGLHLIHPVTVQPGGLWSFLRVAGQLDQYRPEDLIVDDQRVHIEQVMKLLNLDVND